MYEVKFEKVFQTILDSHKNAIVMCELFQHTIARLNFLPSHFFFKADFIRLMIVCLREELICILKLFLQK